MDIKEQILVALGLNKTEEEIKLAWQSKSEDGGTIFVSTAEELEVGVDVSVLLEDGTTVLLPIGTYKTDTGVTFRVEEEGIVGEVMESETEEEVTEEDLSEEVNDTELAEEDKDEYDEEAAVYDWEGMEKRIKNLEDAVADLKRDKEGGDDEVEEMSEEVSDKPKSIKTTEVVEFSAEEVEAIKELKAENEKLKKELAASPADSPINVNKFSNETRKYTKKEISRMTPSERFLMKINK